MAFEGDQLHVVRMEEKDRRKDSLSMHQYIFLTHVGRLDIATNKAPIIVIVKMKLNDLKCQKTRNSNDPWLELV